MAWSEIAIAQAKGEEVAGRISEGRPLTAEGTADYNQAEASLGYGDFQRSLEVADFFHRKRLHLSAPGDPAKTNNLFGSFSRSPKRSRSHRRSSSERLHRAHRAFVIARPTVFPLRDGLFAHARLRLRESLSVCHCMFSGAPTPGPAK